MYELWQVTLLLKSICSYIRWEWGDLHSCNNLKVKLKEWYIQNASQMVTIIIIYCNYVISMKHMATLNSRAIKETRDLGWHFVLLIHGWRCYFLLYSFLRGVWCNPTVLSTMVHMTIMNQSEFIQSNVLIISLKSTLTSSNWHVDPKILTLG